MSPGTSLNPSTVSLILKARTTALYFYFKSPKAEDIDWTIDISNPGDCVTQDIRDLSALLIRFHKEALVDGFF